MELLENARLPRQWSMLGLLNQNSQLLEIIKLQTLFAFGIWMVLGGTRDGRFLMFSFIHNSQSKHNL